MLIFPLINDLSRKIIHVDMDAFFYHLSSSSRYLTKNILCLVIQIRKLFYFGLKLRVKSAYKTNTLC
ncbi:hypothetical protein HO736_00010 [Streptococcus suis]|nr:hypothetical protein [Streptococcus suis]CYW62947.1 winged helix family two component transcriptional regulator [Streptococcus suis]CYX68388.1 winged helix family two component transcriptional regulator [Streptococcus suis]